MIIIGAVVLCVIAYMIIGMFWYSPLLFGKKWAALTNMTPEKVDKEKMNGMYAISAITALITAIVLNYVMAEVDVQSFKEALALGVGLWLGFVLPSTIVNNVFQGKPRQLTFIDSGYQLASILAMTVILYFFIR